MPLADAVFEFLEEDLWLRIGGADSGVTDLLVVVKSASMELDLVDFEVDAKFVAILNKS